MNDEKIIHIAVVAAGIDEEYQNNIITGINKYTNEYNINISCFASYVNAMHGEFSGGSIEVSYFAAHGGMLKSKRFDIGEYSIYNLINFRAFDGAILMTNTICDTETKENIIKRVTDSGIPAVVFDCADYPELYNISINNSSAMTEIINHVIEVHGAKVINFISGPLSNPEATDRYNAFLNVMKEHNLPVENERIFFGEFRTQDGRQAIEEFLQSGLPIPDAFICANDAMALTAISTLEKAGYKVPADVIVTGFDNIYNARNFTPVLTSVDRPLEEMGYKSVEVIMEILKGGSPSKDIQLDSRPVFAESCGCQTHDKEDFMKYKKSTYKKIENFNSGISMLNRLIAGLAETEQVGETMDVLSKFVEELGCEKFCLCLTENWQDAIIANTPLIEYDTHYSSYMTAPLIWDNGEKRSCGYFPSRNMFPEPVRKGGNINYFLPLHFRERCLGYYIITNSDFPIYSLLCHSLTMNLSNSLENVRKLIHLNKAMDELNRLYVIDPMCNIYNRNGFINLVDIKFKECAERKETIMITFIDMDGLKFINDNYGHDEGDFAIQRLAGVIQDSCIDGICARFGGDEFIVFTAGVVDGDDEAFVRRFNSKIDAINNIIKKPYTLSASVGSVIVTTNEDTTLYSVIKQADEKMYDVKKERKNSRRGLL
ncbi:MAG: GGDEF domain-containing protein [Prevotella sp.]|nr:GGDEF domain-containing protein [Alistipes senegalensis]MCM1358789.1 GGDEF domain-containing protein [Prevotella sp.]MCM1474357.1 GGDEF domain-containing protein [Muribaculaceae bacterium]